MRVAARQVYVLISGEREAELYAFILRECACSIYLLQTDKQECGAPDGEDAVQIALVAHRDTDALPYTGDVRSISPRGIANPLSFLRIEKFGETGDGLHICRLWLPDMAGRERERTFRKIKDRIRSISSDRVREDAVSVYYVK